MPRAERCKAQCVTNHEKGKGRTCICARYRKRNKRETTVDAKGARHLREMAADFGIVEGGEQGGMVVAERKACNLAESVEDDVAISVNDVIPSTLLEINDDLSGAHVLDLVQFLHGLRSKGSGP